MDQWIITSNQQNLIAKLFGYKFDIVYKERVKKKVVNALPGRVNFLFFLF